MERPETIEALMANPVWSTETMRRTHRVTQAVKRRYPNSVTLPVHAVDGQVWFTVYNADTRTVSRVALPYEALTEPWYEDEIYEHIFR